MTIELEELKRLAIQVNKLFVVPGSPDALLAPIRALIPRAEPPLAQSAEAFCSSLRSVIVTAGLPYTLALAASHGRRRQLLHCAAELEQWMARFITGGDVPQGDDAATIRAEEDMKKLHESQAGRDALNCEACALLLNLSENDEKIAEAARQLNFQACVLTWSAFEVLSREVFRLHLNCTPQAYAKLLADPDLRKRFELYRVPIERVAEFDFDLSGRLGDLLIEQNDLADLAGIKAVFFALFPNDVVLHSVLNERDLWILFQQRSLIVHRRGIVDRRYVEASGDQQPVGRQLALGPGELREYLRLTAAAAEALVSASLGSPDPK